MAKRPKVKIAGCETCLFRSGDPFIDPEDKETERVYCKALHNNVDMNMMTSYCDFFKVKPEEYI